MTSTSLLPKMAKAAGISFEELIDKIVALSFNGR
jgi:D-alanine-D-alanine ligase-like ATP-grasp enzyme